MSPRVALVSLVFLLLGPALAAAQPGAPPRRPQPEQDPWGSRRPGVDPPPTPDDDRGKAGLKRLTLAVELAMGAGVTTHRADGVVEGATGLVPSVGLGVWFGERTSLTVRAVGQWFDAGVGQERATRTFLGMTLQHVGRNRILVGGGIGAMVLDERAEMGEAEVATGLDLRAGYALVESSLGALAVAGEGTVSLRERGADAAITIQLGYVYR